MLALLGLVPEEILPLGLLLLRTLGTLDGLQRIGVVACVPHLGGNGHGRGGKVLYLFEMEVKPLGQYCQFGHVGLGASGVAADEVGDDLLVQSFFAVDAVEEALEFVELREGRLAHQVEHMVAGMLRSYFQPTADVSRYQLARVLGSSAVDCLVLAPVEQQVVAYATAYEAPLDLGNSIDGAVDGGQP